MRVTSVELRPEGSSEAIELSFRDPKNQDVYQVKSIAPLDADELTPQFYGTSGDSSKRYYNLAAKARQPVVLIGLNPRFGGTATESSYSALRDRLYKIIQSSRTGVVWIVFKADSEEVAAISGTVSKVEAAHFTEKPEVQITFNCSDPMLKALNRLELVPGDQIFVNDLVIVDPVSTAAHGFRFRVGFLEAFPSIVISPPGNEWKFDIRPHGGYLMGDWLYFSSENRNKYLYIQRGATKIQLADVIQPGSIWPIIFPGSNTFHFNKPAVFTTVDHYPTFWGV